MSNMSNKNLFDSYLNAYEFKTVLPGSGKEVTFKPITTGQLKKMLVYENEKDPLMIEEALDKLIESSIVSEGFNISELYLQDRFFLLVEIRKKTKGESYQFTLTCPDCKSQTLININLNDLEVKGYPEDVDRKIQIHDKMYVEMEHTTRENQKEVHKFIKPKMKMMSENQRLTEIAILTHASSIKKVVTDDKELTDVSIEDKMYLLENVPTEVYDKVRNWFDDNNFGLDFTFEVKCVGCDFKEKRNIPVENFFF